MPQVKSKSFKPNFFVSPRPVFGTKASLGYRDLNFVLILLPYEQGWSELTPGVKNTHKLARTKKVSLAAQITYVVVGSQPYSCAASPERTFILSNSPNRILALFFSCAVL